MQNIPVEKYSDLYSIGQKIWCMDGEWRKTTFRRRMTILSDSENRLLIHNPFTLLEQDYRKIQSLGKVTWIVAPNRFHCSEVGGFLEAFPEAELHCSLAAVPALKKGKTPKLILPMSFPRIAEIQALEIKGTRGLGEIVFYHSLSRTLVVTDLVFHGLVGKNRLEKAFFRANGLDAFGPSKVFRYLFTKDEAAVVDSVVEILRWDFDQVVMNHGSIVSSHGKQLLKESFAKRFPKQAKKLDAILV